MAIIKRTVLWLVPMLVCICLYAISYYVTDPYNFFDQNATPLTNDMADAGPTPPPYHNHVTIHEMGKLGNNMFQYASLLGIARMNNRVAFIPPYFTVADTFNVTHTLRFPDAAAVGQWKRIGEPRFAFYEKRFERLPKEPVVLMSYLQSYKYFESIGDEVRKEFTFAPSVDRQAKKMLREVLTPSTTRGRHVTTVGVHVRRVGRQTETRFYSGVRVAPLPYYRNAFGWMRSKYKHVLFLVASDDLAWCSRHLKGPDVKVLPRAKGQIHLSVLAKCDHVIMSVGTFGWWAGWLAGGDVIYFNAPVDPNSWKGERFNMADHYPKHWIGLNGTAVSDQPPR